MHTISISEIQTKLGTDLKTGLTNEDAKKRIATYGLNEIEQAKETSILTIVLRQFKSPIVFLLLFAIGLSFAYSKWGDAIAILIVLVVNACIGFFMEFKAERSMNALRRLTKTAAKVIRNGILLETTTADLVPGDLLYLEAGDIIPTDARIVDAFQLQVNESALTGESLPSEKQECILEENTPLADRKNTLFKGTFVTRGNAHAIVVATGMLTELGKIASLVQAGEQATTPIEKRLAAFSKKLIWITIVIAVVIFFIGILNGKAILDMLTTVIALAVAAIPEGLPIVATLALAHGMMKMARQNVIVKKLASVETLGGTNIICTDKTGTLTYNKISVSHIITADFHSFDKSKPTESARQILHASILCNNANFAGHDEETIEVGDPLEVGLLQFAATHIDLQDFRTRFPKLLEEPFKSETKIMATLHAGPEGKIVFAKGAAEAIIQICTHYLDGDIKKTFPPQLKAYWLKIAEHEASQGLKVLAFAVDNNPDDASSINLKGLTFLGIAALIDAQREEVPEAIRRCHKAGIKVVMITGDHPSTAKNIARQIGIGSDENEKVIEGTSMPAFEKLSRTQKAQWKSTTIFARVSPSQKLDLIQVLQEDHNIVAMTGDGVNDAPALKKADIGIAMGMRGTDVAKEVADMVLKDDSFTAIVSAIKEGRIIFENIRKFLMFLLSSNLSEILVIATLFLINSPVALVPLQILFINLLSDVFPALALGFSAGSNHIMDRPPRDPVKPILNNAQWMSVIVYATIIAGWTFLAALLTQGSLVTEDDVMISSTVLFYTLVLCQLLHVFNVGDHAQAFFKTDVFRNGYVWAGVLFSTMLAVSAYFIEPVNRVLNVGGLQTGDIIVIIGCGFGSLITIQILKRMHAIH